MPPIHPAYLARERQRFMRPDAHRFIRPDWRRFVQPGSELAAYYESIERKYRPDQARVPAGDPGGGQWTDEGGMSEPQPGESSNSERPRKVQFKPEERSFSTDKLVQSGGEDLGSFGDGVSVAKGPNVSHQETYDRQTGETTLSFTGIGFVVVDQRIGNEVTGSVYTVGTPSRPDEGLSVTINRDGKVTVHSTRGG